MSEKNNDNQLILHRPRINRLIETAIQKPVTTVVAGAGYGKTQAVYNFLQTYDAVTIWLQFTEFDNHPVRLWENYVYAVSLQNKELADKFAALGLPETMAAYQRYIKIFSDETKRGRKYVIVYDDFHLIHEASLLEFYRRFISARVPNLSLVFISRSDPEINMISLLSKGWLSVIGEQDLRFNYNEITEYFRMDNIELSQKTIANISQYSDGWIFAIHLIKLSLKKEAVEEQTALFAAKENAFQLLQHEVFDVLSDEMKNFLIKLSFMDQLPVELLKAVFPQSDGLIAEMTKISSFIHYDSFIKTFRIHQLFLDFLKEQQNRIEEREKQEIYRRTAAWYERSGNQVNAIYYYIHAREYNKIVEITNNLPTFLSQESAKFMLQLMDQIPEEEYERYTYLAILYARTLLTVGNVEQAAAKLLAVIQRYEVQPESEDRNSILCDAYITLGGIGILAYPYQKNEFGLHFKKAYEYMPSGSKMISRRMSLNIGAYSIQTSNPAEGEVDQFIETSTYSFAFSRKVMNGSGEGALDLMMAECAFFRRDLTGANNYIQKAISKAREYDQYHVENAAWFYLLRIQIFSGSYSKVQQTLEMYQKRVMEQGHSYSYTCFEVASGWLYSLIGQEEEVPAWIKNSLLSPSTPLSLFDLYVLPRSMYFITKKDYHALLGLVSYYENSIMNTLLLGRIELTLMKAVALYYGDSMEEAFRTLEEAYNLAAPNRLVMPFIEHGTRMRTLIGAVLKYPDCCIPGQWLEEIYKRCSTYGKKVTQIIAGYRAGHNQSQKVSLSKREYDILLNIYHGCTREEIALELNLSVNTVKSSLTTIYAKLGAANSVDAVRIAIEMNLI